MITPHRRDSCPILPILLAGQTVLLAHRCRLLLRHDRVPGASPEDRRGKEHAFLRAGRPGHPSGNRRANHLARGALIAAVAERSQIISPEHVLIASTELI